MCKSRDVGLATFWQKFRETNFIADDEKVEWFDEIF